MPTKPAKKGSAKKPNAVGTAVVNKNWEAGLTKAPFEEVCYLTQHFIVLFFRVLKPLTLLPHSEWNDKC